MEPEQKGKFVPLRVFVRMLPILLPMVEFANKLEAQGEHALAEAFKDSLQFATESGTIMLRFKMEDGPLKGQLKAMARNAGFPLD